MAFFDKQIQFRNFQASATSDYHFRIYKTRDEDNMYMIELCDESNLKFIYRIRLTARNEEKICNENGINPANGLIKYIQKFVNELSDKQWLTCEVSNEKQCNIHFYEFVKNLGGKLILKLSLLIVENAEFQQYVIDTAEKYKRRYIDKKRENEGQRKKLESYEKKIEEMKSDIDEKYKLSKELKDMREERERLDFKYERLKADFERQKEEVADLFEAKQELQNDYAELEKKYEEVDDEADELAALRDQALEKNEILEEENKKLHAALKHIRDKGHKCENKIVEMGQEIQELRMQLSSLQKSAKKLKAENVELCQESSTKDDIIQSVKNELTNLNIANEMKDKIIEEMNAMKNLPAPTENAQPSKPKARPCVLFNRTGPNVPLPNR